MENELIAIAKQGTFRWNQWRKENPNATAELIRADLSEVDLSGADLVSVHLGRANLTRANLRGANLSNAYLGGADLSEADLTDAKLNGAFLNEANLSSTRGITQKQINSASHVEYAKLPKHIKGHRTTAERRAKESQLLRDVLGTDVEVISEEPTKRWWEFWKK